MDINCQILVAEHVEFDPTIKKHSIYNIHNKIEVPTFPSAIVTQVYFKYTFKEDLDSDNIICHIKIFEPSKEIIYEAILPELINFRDSKMKPGIDGVVELRLPVYMEGNYEYAIYANEKKLCSYPVYIEKNLI
ncbi:hypothetical protein [Niallia taxi]|uniref:hypothetical protein n=1 Tax=Niallia taxi TaxID=2499688 RepID=UPI0030099C33